MLLSWILAFSMLSCFDIRSFEAGRSQLHIAVVANECIKMSNETPYIDCRISLIMKRNIRYDGIPLQRRHE